MRNYLYYREGAVYPQDKYFRPSQAYPEYPFADFGLSEESNDVYDMIRDLFIKMELDKAHIGSKDWNPLKEYIQCGNIVLIKPNWVMHKNEAVKEKIGLQCLITNASVVKCIIDYTLLALQGTGKIIVADAPVQSCDFEILQKRMGFKDLEEFYLSKGINIQFADLRNYRSRKENGNVVTYPINSIYKGKVVNLGKHSYFYQNCSEGRLRVTNYDYHDVNKHHTKSTHEYCISEACLEADVIINLPKPKTHRKAGYTGALKNMIGLNAEKDYLPHHTKGAYSIHKGDEYFSDSKVAKMKSDVNDIVDMLDKKLLYRTSRFVRNGASVLISWLNKDKEIYSQGSWWGNNTIWKTILDVNMIVQYLDKQGKLRNEIQRTVITLGDMIISGEGEGPLLATPKYTYSLLFADNSILFDEILIRFMGFQEDKFRLLKEAKKNRKLISGNCDAFEVCSNKKEWQDTLDNFKSDYKFMPAFGWQGYLD